MTSPDTPAAPLTSALPTESGKKLLPWLVAVAFFMEALDTTILSTAVPSIAEALEVTPLSMKAVMASYTLSLAVFIPISGWMADRFGTRRVFASAIATFTLGSFLCGICSSIHALVACRILQGCGGALMLPVGRLTMVRTFAKSELIRAMTFVAIPGLIGPMLGPFAGGLIVAYFHWSVIFFVNIPIGLVGLYMVYRHLPNYSQPKTPPLDFLGLVLFGTGVALLSYVLEVFGEHTLTNLQMLILAGVSLLLLTAYGFHARRTPFPLLRMNLFGIRTFRISVIGSFITRLGIGGIPFLFPLLYQVGLGFSPVQSGLMMMPQALAAMSLKVVMPKILARIGYKRVLQTNTIILGLMILLFATINADTPVWLLIIQAFVYGFFTSMQYTSMNTLVYADVTDEQTSSASTIASTMQQMAISFGVAAASVTTAIFIMDRYHANSAEMIQGIHKAFLVLGSWTIVSSLLFLNLKGTDGESVSQHKTEETHG
ncbi:DHA2 family efflux MFS transporter permease subunit [Telmatocola sphagniphila]|uniref:DHA2 family efflux MFS transporter permease subunit n=1 Tax=Telmatocola sphagniphila TaxID=1123043 RepID=A0A8E6B1Q1_9BACT|nr:DHA2 family efflux MFS transporter permease subunit [Telmatocola sphagniphila]QVL30016.1 DHA2 family efflux MFS transporter permease subunit [Telmatocola sphagniphila]